MRYVPGKKWPKLEKPLNFALQSSYAQLSELQRDELRAAWLEKNLLQRMQYAIAPLVLLYDQFALRFVGPPDAAISQEALIARLEKVTAEASDKYSTAGVMLHGALFLNNLMADRIRISSHIDLPDLDAVIRDVDSAEGKRAAGFLRSSAMANLAFSSPPENWAEQFWTRSYELIPCRATQ
jgi:hypothetical protein